MKRLFKCFLCLAAISLLTGASEPLSNEYYGVFIGMKKGSMRGDSDADAMCKQFEKLSNSSAARYLYGDIDSGKRLLRKDIQSAITDFKSLMLPGDTFFLFISSHGMSNGYSYHPSIYIPGSYPGTRAFDINNKGEIIVWDSLVKGLIYYGSGIDYTMLPTISGDYVYPVDINNLGQILCQIEGQQAFIVYSGGEDGYYTPLPDIYVDIPDALAFYPVGINDSGQIVGNYQTSSGTRGFLYSGGHYVPLPDIPGARHVWPSGINNAGQIVGSYDSEDWRTVGFWYNGSYFAVGRTASFYSYAIRINNEGQILGRDAFGSFIHYNGSYTPLPLPANISSELYPSGINDFGQVVGYYKDDTGKYRGFCATPGEAVEIGPPDEFLTDRQLGVMLKDLPDAARKVVLIDTCYAGGFWGNYDLFEGGLQTVKNTAILASSTVDMLSFISRNNGMGLFTIALIDAFSPGTRGYIKPANQITGVLKLSDLASWIKTSDKVRPYFNTNVIEKAFGDLILFTPNMWTPVAYTTADFVDGLELGKVRAGSLSGILPLLLD